MILSVHSNRVGYLSLYYFSSCILGIWFTRPFFNGRFYLYYPICFLSLILSTQFLCFWGLSPSSPWGPQVLGAPAPRWCWRYHHWAHRQALGPAQSTPADCYPWQQEWEYPIGCLEWGAPARERKLKTAATRVCSSGCCIHSGWCLLPTSKLNFGAPQIAYWPGARG